MSQVLGLAFVAVVAVGAIDLARIEGLVSALVFVVVALAGAGIVVGLVEMVAGWISRARG